MEYKSTVQPIRNCWVNHSLLIRPTNQYIQMSFILPIPKSSLGDMEIKEVSEGRVSTPSIGIL